MTRIAARRRLPLQLYISIIFVSLILLIGGVLGALSHSRSQEMVDGLSDDIFERVVREASVNVASLLSPAETTVALLARHPLIKSRTLDERLAHVPALANVLQRSPDTTSVYVGYDDGDFILVRGLSGAGGRFEAPEGSAYLVQSIERDANGTKGIYVYCDKWFGIIERRDTPGYTAYDPRQRPWFKLAANAPGQVKTAPYVFFSTQEIGITIAERAAGGGATFGADITLATLAEVLKRQVITRSAEVVLTGLGQSIVAHPKSEKVLYKDADNKLQQSRVDDLGSPALSLAYATLSGSEMLKPGRIHVDGGDWKAMLAPVHLRDGEPLTLAIAAPVSELMSGVNAMLRETTYWMIAIISAVAVVAYFIARAIARPIRALSHEAARIREFDFSETPQAAGFIREVSDLADGMANMKETIRRFLDISRAVARETNFDRLVEKLSDETISATDAVAAAVYLVSRDETELMPALARVRGGRHASGDLRDFDMTALPPEFAEAVKRREPVDYVLDADRIERLGLAEIVGNLDAPASDVVVVPLFERKGTMVGAILLLCGAPADHALISFISALSGTAAVSVETQELIAAQKRLFESFIKLIAGAIDAKSPYTGGHCERVPELTRMLAEAAHQAESGPYAAFTLDEERREAIHVASWLHDCGKVTTPDFVVDKATKLETIYDRLHEIRMRFEVMKREAEVDCWRRIADGGDRDALGAELEKTWAELDADFAFIAECNVGGEFMAPAKIAELERIAARTWTRTIDDRIGLSHEETTRRNLEPAPDLPVAEPVLRDAVDQVIPRGDRDRIPDDNPWGFKLDMPDHLYNRGELYNLRIGRGTLTAEDRYKINEHIVQTIKMLSELPFPRHLHNVPEIAGGHHEKMGGTGYPKRLTRDEMLPVARMMAIADIFEALTAVDRPYKKGKTLSEALKIMSFMCKDAHVDAELFELFLRSGVYMDYARQFLRPEQIDDVDIEIFLAA